MSEKNKQTGFSKNKKIIIAVAAVLVCIIAAYLIAGAVNGSLNPTKWGKSETSVKETSHSLYCAVNYPDLQSDGAIWQTGGMAETHAINLKECLEKDFEKDFFKFASDGTISAVGELKAANGYSFAIQKNTTRSPEPLSNKPEEIILEDSMTYEIYYCDPDGEEITKLTAEIKEKTDISETQGSSDSSEPTESGSTGSFDELTTDPVDPVDPTDDTVSKATEPTENKETESELSSTPTKATDPTKTTNPTDPTKTTEPKDPAKSTDPTEKETLPAVADTDNIGDGSIFD